MMHGCTKCRGLGSCPATMDAVRVEYGKVRKLLCDGRGMKSKDVDERVAKKVERAKFMGVNRAAIWFEVAFYMLRDFGMLENYWEILAASEKRTKG